MPPEEFADGDAPTEDAGIASRPDGVGSIPAITAPGMGNPAQIPAGTILDEKLRIERVLGQGGMGVVYLADHIQLDRRVALKLTHTGGEKATKSLLREARAMASITHENVVTVYDVGTIGEQVFIAMEYLDGGTARSWLRGRQRTWREIVALYLAAGRGLAAAHARGLVHRDFKPDNILIGKDGKVCVADFGLALAAARRIEVDRTDPDPEGPSTDAADDTRLTAAGTPAYMPPEQFREGAAANERSDQFAFCVSLYEALCGFRPFPSSDLAQMTNPDVNRLPPETPETTRLPKHIRRALWRGLSADPDDRFPSMDALLRELARDPAAAIRRFGLASIAIGSTAAITYVVADRGSDPCTGAEQRLEGVWDAATKSKVEQAFTDTGISYADQAWEHASSLLAAYANAWAATHRETCEATQKHGSQSAELMDLRMACLDDRLDALSATVAILAEPDAEVVRNAFAAASRLPRIETCNDTEALREISAIPEHQADVARAVRHGVNVALALLAAGKVQPGLEMARSALEEAEASGLPVLLASARLAVAQGAQRQREWDLATEMFRSAMDAAIVARDDVTVVKALISLLYVEGYQLALPNGELWAQQAHAWTERMGSPPVVQATLLNNEGLIAREKAQYEDAIGAFEQALELLVDSPILALRTRGMLAETYRRMGDLESAGGLYDENLRATETAVGAWHPLFAQELNNSGAVLFEMGQLDEAQTRYERSLEIRMTTFGEDSLTVAESLQNIAALMAARGDFASAMERFQRAWKIMEGRAGPSPQVTVLANLGKVAHELGDDDGAIAWFERALELGDKELGPATPVVVDERHGLAKVLADSGDLDRAQEVLARAMEDLRAAGIEDGPHKQRLYALRGDLRLRAKEPEGALEDLRLTLELIDKLQFVDQRARIGPLRGAGEALLELGKPEEAAKYLVEAKEELAALEEKPDGRLELALARAHVATGDKQAAYESAVEAKRLLDPADTDRVALADALIAQTK